MYSDYLGKSTAFCSELNTSKIPDCCLVKGLLRVCGNKKATQCQPIKKCMYGLQQQVAL